MHKYVFEFPAITKQKDGWHAAYCIALSIIGIGKSEEEAILNLQNAIKQNEKDFEAIVKPIKN